MPIKEILGLTIIILGGIAATHPLNFSNEVRKVEFSILKEASRTNNWGDLSFAAKKKVMRKRP